MRDAEELFLIFSTVQETPPSSLVTVSDLAQRLLGNGGRIYKEASVAVSQGVHQLGSGFSDCLVATEHGRL